jgi:hypothetical protein
MCESYEKILSHIHLKHIKALLLNYLTLTPPLGPLVLYCPIRLNYNEISAILLSLLKSCEDSNISLFSLNRHSSKSDVKMFSENYGKSLENVFKKELNVSAVTQNPTIFFYNYSRLNELKKNLFNLLISNEGEPNKLTNHGFYNYLYNPSEKNFYQYSENASLIPSTEFNIKITSIDLTIKTVHQLSKTVHELSKPVNQLSKLVNELSKPMNQLSKPMNQLSKPMNQLSKPVNELSKPMRRLPSYVRRLTKNKKLIGRK